MVALLLPWLLPLPVEASGIGISPPTIEIADAYRGNEYRRTVTVFNAGQEARSFALEAKGEIEDWITFHDPDDPETAIEIISVPGRPSAEQAGTARVLVRIRLPDDVASGTYSSRLYVTSDRLSGDDGDSGHAVRLQASTALAISVSGSQILRGEVGRIEAGNTEIGLPLVIKVNFANTGNVVARPDIDVAIINAADGKVAEFSHSETEVRVDAREVIELEWDTSAAGKTGDYTAQVSVSLAGESIDTRNVPFKIFPRGGLAAQGRLVSLSFEQPPALRAMTKVVAEFENTGPVEVSARLVAEVYRDGNLVDLMESEAWLVSAGEDEVIPGYYRPNRPGEYVLKGHVAYEGRRTATQDISFTIAGGGGVPTPAVAGAGGVLALGTVYMVLRKRRNGGRSERTVRRFLDAVKSLLRRGQGP